MFDPGGAVRPERSYQGGGVVPRRVLDDKSPTVPSRASPKQSGGALGDLGGRKEKTTQHQQIPVGARQRRAHHVQLFNRSVTRTILR
jgi:hypothetical protein